MIIKLIVSGKVQGVGYRQSIFQYINENYLQINGYVKNLSNGNVEIILEGEAEDLRKVEDFSYQGSPICSVDHIEKIQLHDRPIELQTFCIEY